MKSHITYNKRELSVSNYIMNYKFMILVITSQIYFKFNFDSSYIRALECFESSLNKNLIKPFKNYLIFI